MMQNRFSLDRLLSWSLLLTIILIPLFFIPSASVPLETGKTFLLIIGVALSLSLFLVKHVRNGEISLPTSRILFFVILIPLSLFLSAHYGLNSHMSLFGYDLGLDTWGFLTLGFVLLFLTSLSLRTREKIFYVYTGYFLVFVILALYTLLKFFAPAHLSFYLFHTGSESPLGGWMDIAAYFSASIILIFLALERLAMNTISRVLLYIAFIASLFILAVVNVGVSWILISAFSLFYLIYRSERFSYLALALLIISGLFLLNPSISSSGTHLDDVLSQKFSVSNTLVSPTLSTTWTVTKPVLKSHPILGSGPNTFDLVWMGNKPREINGSAFWNVSFPYGYGFLPTLLATTGILGALLWLIFFALYIRLGVRTLASITPDDKVGGYLASSSFFFSIFLWAMMFSYVPSKAILMLAFIFTGIFLGTTNALGILGERVFIFRNNKKFATVSVLVLIALLGSTVAFAYTTLRGSFADIHFRKAVLAANGGDADTARSESIRAANLSGEDIYYGAISQVAVAKANAILNNASSSVSKKDQAEFQTDLSEAITAAQMAVNARKENYQNWVALGSLYESLVPAPFSVAGAYDNGKGAYLEAEKRNPNSPEPYFLLARLEVANKNYDAARAYIKQALSLKSDYADAFYLLTQIDAAQNNIKEAIASATTLVGLAPDNAGILFQLGVLKYMDGDYTGARDAENAALSISPDYPNAKYYDALALSKLGKKDEATKIINDLILANPTVPTLKAILANIEAGRDPQYKITPPTPPIKQ